MGSHSSFVLSGAPLNLEARRAQLRADLELARQEFHTLVSSIPDQAWTQPSRNAGWNNDQLVFHILLGFILVQPLSFVLIFFGHLPDVCSQIFAGILNLATPLFNLINKIGPRFAARWLGRAGIVRKFDQISDALVKQLDHSKPGHWVLSMRYPTRWDPRFKDDMHLEEVFRYAIAHLHHHSAQITQ